MRAKFVNEIKLSGPSENEIFRKIRQEYEKSPFNVVEFIDEHSYVHGDHILSKLIEFFESYFEEHGYPDDLEDYDYIWLGVKMDNKDMISKGIEMITERMDDLKEISGKLYLFLDDSEDIKDIVFDPQKEIFAEALEGGVVDDIFMGSYNIISFDTFKGIWKSDNILPKTRRYLAEEILPKYSIELDGKEIKLSNTDISIKDEDIVIKYQGEEYSFIELLENQENLEDIKENILRAWTTTEELASESEFIKEIEKKIQKELGNLFFRKEGIYIHIDDIFNEIINKDPDLFLEGYLNFISLLNEYGIKLKINEPQVGFIGNVSPENFHEELINRLEI